MINLKQYESFAEETTINESAAVELERELKNVINRYKSKMDPEEIYDVVHTEAERLKNEF